MTELLDSVYNQMNSLLGTFKQQTKRKKREAKAKMDCETIIKVLSLYEELNPLISTAGNMTMQSNLKKIQELSNKIQMYSTFDGVSDNACDGDDHSALKEKVNSLQTSLGNFHIYYECTNQ